MMAGLSCILQSYILSCEMTVVVLVLVGLIMWKRTFRKERLKELLKAAIWCLLINAWFWVPLLKMIFSDQYFLSALVSKNIQYMGTRLAGVFQIYPSVGGGQTGMYNGEPIQLGAAFWCVFFLYLILRVCRTKKATGRHWQIRMIEYCVLGYWEGCLCCFSVPGTFQGTALQVYQ